MITLPTSAYYQALYLSLAKGENPELDVTQFTDFQNKGFCLGGIVGGAALDATTLFNNVYPQFANAQGINLGLASSGIQGILPATPAILTLEAQGLTVSKTYDIPVGTLISAPNGAVYSVISVNGPLNVVSVTTVSPTFYARSISTGQNTAQTISTILTLTPPIISTDQTSSFFNAEVTGFVDGVDQESLANATNRLIEVKQTPLCIGRGTDFKNLAIDSENAVTDAVVLTNNQIDYSPDNYNVAIFDISGTPITDSTLNLGLIPGTTEVVFTRTSSPASIANTQTVMDAQDIVGAFPIVSTVETQGLAPVTDPVVNPFFKITVTLQNGFDLSSVVNVGGYSLTISKLIQRETRRAICNQPYGASLVQDLTTFAYISSSFAISAIEQQLDSSLGTPTTTGTIGSFLLDRTVQVWDGSIYVSVASIPLTLGLPALTPSDSLPWIYDVATVAGIIYDNIAVEPA